MVGTVWAATAPAQNYPSRPITFIVPFAVGGLTDVPVRVLTAMLQERIGQNIIVENKPGGSGTIGGAFAVRAEPDGYTLFANSVADTQNLHYIPVPYNAIDGFAMIGMIVEGPPLVLIIDAKLPYKTLAELVADAKANPNKLSFGTSGPATSPAIALTQLNSLAKTEIVGVPYRGSGEAARNVAAGASKVSSPSIPRPSRLRTTARCARSRSRARARSRPGPRCRRWTNSAIPISIIAVSSALPRPPRRRRPIIAYLNKQLNEIVQSEAFRKRMEALGMTVPADNTPEYLAAFMRRETARQEALAKLSGHQPMAPQR